MRDPRKPHPLGPAKAEPAPSCPVASQTPRKEFSSKPPPHPKRLLLSCILTSQPQGWSTPRRLQTRTCLGRPLQAAQACRRPGGRGPVLLLVFAGGSSVLLFLNNCSFGLASSVFLLKASLLLVSQRPQLKVSSLVSLCCRQCWGSASGTPSRVSPRRRTSRFLFFQNCAIPGFTSS